MILNKKAVSPLIATVLLVMIVVSIGAAVMVVIQGVSEESISTIESEQKKIDCGVQVAVKVLQVGTSNRVCYESDRFTFQVQNTGNKDINGWDLLVLGTTGANLTKSSSGNVSFLSGGVETYNITFGSVGTVEKIELSPRIVGTASQPSITCEEPNLIWDTEEISDLDSCSDATVTWDDSAKNVG